MVEDILPRHSNARPNKKGLPSVSLTADSSLCRGSQGRPLPQYQHEKTTATAVVFSSPRRMSAAALSAAVTTTKLIGDAPNSQAEPTPKKRSNPNASCSSGEGVWGRGASLREAASSPESPLPSALTWIYQIKRLCRAGDFVYNKLVETLSIEGAPQERRGRDVDSYDAAAAQNKDRLHDGSQPV